MSDFDRFKFLTEDDRALLDAGDEDTDEEFIQRMQDNPEEEGDTNMAKRQVKGRYPTGMPSQGGYSADDPHADYPRAGQGTQRKLDTAAVDYSETVSVIDAALGKAEAAFATAFERSDAQATVRRRIDGTANTKSIAAAAERRSRIG